VPEAPDFRAATGRGIERDASVRRDLIKARDGVTLAADDQGGAQ
jgi:hypothetical protein